MVVGARTGNSIGPEAFDVKVNRVPNFGLDRLYGHVSGQAAGQII
jgi:hypothetical protein